MNTWNETGEFYIAIAGKNGAFDEDDSFTIDVEVDGNICDGIVPSTDPAPGVQAGGGFETVILWDRGQIKGDPGTKDTLASNLALLAARPEVMGVVVDLDLDTRVQALHAQADLNPACVYAENLVARSIKDIVDSYRQNNPLEYVVLVGGDDSIPFFRYAESALLGPEEDYDPPVDGPSNAALRLNYILGQDEYGSRIKLLRSDGELPIPDLSVGRVVETASEANTMISAYLGTPAGVVVPNSSLTTAYDFLSDSGTEVYENLVGGTGGTPQTDVLANGCRGTGCLIDPGDRSPDDPLSWTANDLRASLFNSGRHDLIFLAGHFSANSALAADYETSIITTELAASSVDMTNTIVFSGGCHSGYNIVLDDTVPGVTLPLDWAQAFAQKGATLIAGTGYQYGDTDFIEYSERLYADFATELREGTGPVSVGQALVDAKRDYLATTPDMRGLHRKSVIISTVFGLPMLSVDMPGERLTNPGNSSVIGALTDFPTNTPGSTLATQYADLTINDSLTEKTKLLTNLEGGTISSTYYTGPDGVVTNPLEPAVPLVSKNVSVDGKVLRGVGFRGGSYTDIGGITPLTGAPATEIRGVHTPFASEVFFPMRLAQVNYFGELGGGTGTRLLVTPAQHRVDSIGDLTSTLRRYDSLDLRLYYSANLLEPALSGPPSISAVRAEIDGSNVQFAVRAVGDTWSGIQEVWVTYTVEGAPSLSWTSVDLSQPDPVNDSTLWTGSIAAPAGTLDFVVQAANGVGIVTLSDNFGEYYQVEGPPAPAPTPSSLAVSAPASGPFGATVTATATLTDESSLPVENKRIVFTLGGATRVATTDGAGVASVDLPLYAVPDNYRITASFRGSETLARSKASTPFTVAKAPTAITLSGLEPVLPGEATTVTAKLVSTVTGAPIPERTVYYTVEGPAGSATITAITDKSGIAELGQLDLPVGDYSVSAYFLGSVPLLPGPDVRVLSGRTYLPATASGAIRLAGIGTISLQDGTAPTDDGVLPVNSSANASADFFPAGPGPYEGVWDWGDGTTGTPTVATVSASGAAWTASGEHQYAEPGVYTVTLTITDSSGNTYQSIYQFVVVYDPAGGFVTGGGWIDSPAGAYVADPLLTGKASFGFVAKYKKGTNVPSGNTQFKFKAADLEFESTSYQWLVVAGARAQFKGDGTINGIGNYGFILTAVDSDVAGGGDEDTFRIKIWDKDNGDVIVYDNQFGAGDDDPVTTTLGGGSIKIHKG